MSNTLIYALVALPFITFVLAGAILQYIQKRRN